MTEKGTKPFTTDGCSGGMSAAWRLVFGRNPPWEDVCVRHDWRYYCGGTPHERLRADITMMTVVSQRGHPYFAIAMFLMVRAFGGPYLPFSWRWGYKYDYWLLRGYRK